MTDWKNWAERRISRSGAPAPEAATVARSIPQAAPGQGQLPPAPPGMAWSYHPTAGFVLVQVGVSVVAAQRQPDGAPESRNFTGYAVAPPQGRPGTFPVAVERSCVLLKPDGRDPYAELLMSLPDLAPPTAGYDSRTGSASPEAIQELGHLYEFANLNGASDQGAAFPAGGRPLARQSVELGSVAPPAVSAEQKAS